MVERQERSVPSQKTSVFAKIERDASDRNELRAVCNSPGLVFCFQYLAEVV